MHHRKPLLVTGAIPTRFMLTLGLLIWLINLSVYTAHAGICLKPTGLATTKAAAAAASLAECKAASDSAAMSAATAATLTFDNETVYIDGLFDADVIGHVQNDAGYDGVLTLQIANDANPVTVYCDPDDSMHFSGVGADGSTTYFGLNIDDSTGSKVYDCRAEYAYHTFDPTGCDQLELRRIYVYGATDPAGTYVLNDGRGVDFGGGSGEIHDSECYASDECWIGHGIPSGPMKIYNSHAECNGNQDKQCVAAVYPWVIEMYDSFATGVHGRTDGLRVERSKIGVGGVSLNTTYTNENMTAVVAHNVFDMAGSSNDAFYGVGSNGYDLTIYAYNNSYQGGGDGWGAFAEGGDVTIYSYNNIWDEPERRYLAKNGGTVIADHDITYNQALGDYDFSGSGTITITNAIAAASDPLPNATTDWTPGAEAVDAGRDMCAESFVTVATDPSSI